MYSGKYYKQFTYGLINSFIDSIGNLNRKPYIKWHFTLKVLKYLAENSISIILIDVHVEI